MGTRRLGERGGWILRRLGYRERVGLPSSARRDAHHHPPLATELFEVRLKLYHSQVDGGVLADFAEFGRQASSPYLVVQVLSNP